MMKLAILVMYYLFHRWSCHISWNTFSRRVRRDNISTAFSSLREEKNFADVTLACEDGQWVNPHKVILAA